MARKVINDASRIAPTLVGQSVDADSELPFPDVEEMPDEETMMRFFESLLSSNISNKEV